jgi:[citrate (pro-3S)-lyase] ligase
VFEQNDVRKRITYGRHTGFRKNIADFLEKLGLGFDDDVELSVSLEYKDGIAATASLAGPVVKCVGIDPAFRGHGLTARLLTDIEMEAYHRGEHHLFLFTLPANRRWFEELGYKLVIATENVLLLEKPGGEIDRFILSLERERGKRASRESSGIIVMNANPFTLGHLYLIERAIDSCDHLYIFPVLEGKSVFPYEVRRRLIEEGTAHMDSVTVLPGSPYIISSATFPGYFISSRGERRQVQAELDLRLFSSRIAPSLGSDRRYVGTEPYCPVTSAYNLAMKKILPQYGIQLIEIPRTCSGDFAVSASSVRADLAAGIDETRLKTLVPESTLHFLLSPEAMPIIAQIRQFPESRH